MSKLIDIIERNMSGRDPSLLLDLSSKLPLLYSSSYWAITGGGGSGKTSLADQLFILDIEDKDPNIKWVYHVLERNLISKYARWVSGLIYKHENIILDFNTILQNKKKNHILTPTEFKLIKHYDNYIDTNIKPRMKICNNGRYTTDRIIKDIVSSAAKKDYSTLIHITDHVGKVKKSNGQNSYDALQEYSDAMASLRDTHGIINVDINQLMLKKVNDVSRRKTFGAEILPSDMYGGEIIQQNADVLLGLLHPKSMNISNHRGYDDSEFEIGDDSRLREVKIMKSNFDMQGYIPCLFIGETSRFIEIPSPSEIDYKQMKLKYL